MDRRFGYPGLYITFKPFKFVLTVNYLDRGQGRLLASTSRGPLALGVCAGLSKWLCNQFGQSLQKYFLRRKKYFLRRKIFLAEKNISCGKKYFLRRKIFLAEKNIFLAEKNIFLAEKKIFLAEKNISCGEKYFLRKKIFLAEKNIFLAEKNFFLAEKIYFLRRKIYFLRRKIFLDPIALTYCQPDNISTNLKMMLLFFLGRQGGT